MSPYFAERVDWSKSFLLVFFLIFIFSPVCACLHTHGCAYKSEGSCGGHKSVGSPRAGVAGSCKPPDLMLGNKLALPQLQDAPFTRAALQPLAISRVIFVYHHS